MRAIRVIKARHKFERDDIYAATVDLKYAKDGLGVIISKEAENHSDYINSIYFREIIDLRTGYVLAKVAARDVLSTVKHIVSMEWKYIESRNKKRVAGYYTSPHLKAELYSYMRYELKDE